MIYNACYNRSRHGRKEDATDQVLVTESVRTIKDTIKKLFYLLFHFAYLKPNSTFITKPVATPSRSLREPIIRKYYA